jgi:hypothetical protein
VQLGLQGQHPDRAKNLFFDRFAKQPRRADGQAGQDEVPDQVAQRVVARILAAELDGLADPSNTRGPSRPARVYVCDDNASHAGMVPDVLRGRPQSGLSFNVVVAIARPSG